MVPTCCLFTLIEPVIVYFSSTATEIIPLFLPTVRDFSSKVPFSFIFCDFSSTVLSNCSRCIFCFNRTCDPGTCDQEEEPLITPGREREDSTNFYRERLRPEVQLLTILNTIFHAKGITHSATRGKLYPFHISCLELCIPFTPCKCIVV